MLNTLSAGRLLFLGALCIEPAPSKCSFADIVVALTSCSIYYDVAIVTSWSVFAFGFFFEFFACVLFLIDHNLSVADERLAQDEETNVVLYS